jgi:hypothetical protein
LLQSQAHTQAVLVSTSSWNQPGAEQSAAKGRMKLKHAGTLAMADLVFWGLDALLQN